MTSVLTSLFSRDPKNTFQFEIPTISFNCDENVFMGHSFKKSNSNEKLTCFWANSYSNLKLQAQKLKTLRHPNVLTYYDSLEIENCFYLITEACVPLEIYLNEVELTIAQKELFVSWGFYQILNCLTFLHNEVKILQNNLKKSIYVTSAGDWKLSGFHNTKPFSSSQPDLNDLAFVAWQIFNGFTKSENIQKSINKIPKRLQPLFKKLNSKEKIFDANILLKECRTANGFMKNKFVDTLIFLEEFQLKDLAEKKSFFLSLENNLDIFPKDVAKHKILPKLIDAYQYGDAGVYVIEPMFKIGAFLDEDEYQYKIIPCLVKLFNSSDRAIRVKLLEKIDEFSLHMKAEIVNEKIYGNLVTGFTDTNPVVRECTVKAMVSIAEKLNYYNLNTDLIKYLARLQGNDDQPGIRTNTTICLGKIGCYFDVNHRQQILINAFTKALKDPFPPARMAGVLALSATQQYYSLNEVALKVLPSLSFLTIDPEKQVRDQSFKALKGFIEKLEKASENPELIVELEAEVKAGGKNSLLNNDKLPQWASWALKALSAKFTNVATTNLESLPLKLNELSVQNKNEKKLINVCIKNECSEFSDSLTNKNDLITNKNNALVNELNTFLSDGWKDLDDEEEHFEESNESFKNNDYFKEKDKSKNSNLNSILTINNQQSNNNVFNNKDQHLKKNNNWLTENQKNLKNDDCLLHKKAEFLYETQSQKLLKPKKSVNPAKLNGPMKLGAKKITKNMDLQLDLDELH